MRVFLSHTHHDRDLAQVVREHLTTAGAEVFDSAVDVLPGENWLAAAGDALERADVVVFLLSEEAASSPAVRNEIEYAISTPRLRDRVIPVLLGKGVEVPWIVRKLQYLEFSKRNESPAVVAREIVKHLPQPVAS